MTPTICPITQEIIVDPVATVDGHVYERSAIEQWFRDHNTSPNTGGVLSSKILLQIHSIRQQNAEHVNKMDNNNTERQSWEKRKNEYDIAAQAAAQTAAQAAAQTAAQTAEARRTRHNRSRSRSPRVSPRRGYGPEQRFQEEGMGDRGPDESDLRALRARRATAAAAEETPLVQTPAQQSLNALMGGVGALALGATVNECHKKGCNVMGGKKSRKRKSKRSKRNKRNKRSKKHRRSKKRRG